MGETKMEAAPADPALIADLVDANRILFDQGVVDAFGHASVRHPADPGLFLLARNMAPGQVTASDILTFDLDGEARDAQGRAVYLERFIHGEIYRVRPDVGAIVHSHSPSVVPYSVVPGTPLRPICHMCGFLGSGVPNFDIREAAGDGTDLLIRDRKLGAALAAKLGRHAAVLMRGHGSTVVGKDLRQVVYRAVYTETNARLQSEAMRLGEPVFLSPAEAEAASASIEPQNARAWNLWRERARARS
jgi:ribulose-5-phosphate 4-epimerase/fuculose-1-phosphate aldolase